jgi:large-conductance mechanosensitive channel
MEINYTIVGIVVFIVVLFIVFLARRNRKDQKDYEKDKIQSEIPPKSHDKDRV